MQPTYREAVTQGSFRLWLVHFPAKRIPVVVAKRVKTETLSLASDSVRTEKAPGLSTRESWLKLSGRSPSSSACA